MGARQSRESRKLLLEGVSSTVWESRAELGFRVHVPGSGEPRESRALEAEAESGVR
jgi:hypothetical protein